MQSFYPEVVARLKAVREEKAAEDKEEAEYQMIKKQVEDKGLLKRLINDLF